MAKLEDIRVGSQLTGIVGDKVVTAVAVEWFGNYALTLTYRTEDNILGETMLYRDMEPNLRLVSSSQWTFDAGLQFTCLFTQQLTHAMKTSGVEACAQMRKDVFDSRAENAKALAYRLFTIADKKGWNAEAFAYNSLVVAWPEIQSRAAQLQAEKPVQLTLDLDLPNK